MSGATPLSDVMAKHPPPWRYMATRGNIVMLDAAGGEVPLFTMLDLAVAVSVGTAAAQRKAAAAAQLQPEATPGA